MTSLEISTAIASQFIERFFKKFTRRKFNSAAKNIFCTSFRVAVSPPRSIALISTCFSLSSLSEFQVVFLFVFQKRLDDDKCCKTSISFSFNGTSKGFALSLCSTLIVSTTFSPIFFIKRFATGEISVGKYILPCDTKVM